MLVQKYYFQVHKNDYCGQCKEHVFSLMYFGRMENVFISLLQCRKSVIVKKRYSKCTIIIMIITNAIWVLLTVSLCTGECEEMEVNFSEAFSEEQES